MDPHPFQIMIEEVHPLKQGLKPGIIVSSETIDAIEEVHPLKQGLKPNMSLAAAASIPIEEVHPLKQGLKPFNILVRNR